MTPTPPSTTPSSGGAHSPADQLRAIRKRNRVPVSCQACRTKKKCDRTHPCTNCVKRDGPNTTSCHYAASTPRKKGQSQSSSGPGDMQNRIDRLENLVLSLMHGGANVEIPASSSHPPSAPPTQTPSSGKSVTNSTPSAKTDLDDDGSDIDDGLANSLGVLKVDSEMGKSMYVGQEHWHMLLADIAEVKNYFTHHKKELEKGVKKVVTSKQPPSLEGTALLIGTPSASEVELRAELPPKSSIISLCERFFSCMDSWVCIIHAPTFRRQLQEHWQDPSQTPLMWVGLLYSVLSLAALSYHKAGDEPPELKGRSLDLAAEYRLRCAQCLITADYTKADEYTVETMLLYIFGEFSSRWDVDVGLWLVLSMTTRIAFRMGYHRDGKWFKSLSPFQAEMRRRVWTVVRVSDVIFSHHLSLPRMINESDCDTELPSNLLEEDFGLESVELPASRPAYQRTKVDYMLARCRLSMLLGKILKATNTVGRHVTYDEILQFDTDLRETMAQVPPHLKILPVYETAEPAHAHIIRFQLDILYQKIMCVLHKPYLPRARQNPRYAHSHRSAVEASLAMLRHMEILHRETQPNGRLRSMKWQVGSLATKDFTLPAALLAVELRYLATAAGPDHTNPFGWTTERQRQMMRSLEVTGDIWQEMAGTSVDAYKASIVLKLMLDSVRNAKATDAGLATPDGAPSHDLSCPRAPEMRPEQSAAVGLGMLAGSISPDSPGTLSNKLPPLSHMNLPGSVSVDPAIPPDMQFDPFGMNRVQSPMSMFAQLGGNGSEIMSNIDWDAFESYTQTMNWSAVDPSFVVFPSGEDPNASPPTVEETMRYTQENYEGGGS
ncbi:related to transcription activator protein acu-15 [Cephalotrichum gorgonifer]|uniref:Related to transcription activator protein acu-15 n=1 Tax=Cephalotrichum gorgonifer TaxID=2041049 RepID=A0AAE8MWN1_9PEZI|nr:related to transcription activator protein acu-15 [Cephalotrichum gorgonifer]